MKKVILIGDSIRLGYCPTVRAELEGVAHVTWPEPNCQHSVNVLLHFNEWVIRNQPDVLHINAGLWDIRHIMRGQPGNIVPIEFYRFNVKRLLAFAQQQTQAKIVWATCTPINQAHADATHKVAGILSRHEGDVALYNAAAVQECRAAGVQVNDLYQFVLDHNPDQIRSPDGVHYTPEGYALLGRHVASVIRPLI